MHLPTGGCGARPLPDVTTKEDVRERHRCFSKILFWCAPAEPRTEVGLVSRERQIRRYVLYRTIRSEQASKS